MGQANFSSLQHGVFVCSMGTGLKGDSCVGLQADSGPMHHACIESREAHLCTVCPGQMTP